MSYGDTGPRWFWFIVLFLALCGLIGFLFLIVKGVMWLIEHIQIV